MAVVGAIPIDFTPSERETDARPGETLLSCCPLADSVANAK